VARITRKLEEEIISKTRANIGEGIAHCDSKHARNEENQKYTRGLQWSKADLERQERRERPAVPWNDTFKVVHAISNREMVSRLVPKVFGRGSADEGVANVLDEACRWQRQASGSEHYESMAFRSAAMSGYGCVKKFWDPVANNGDGLIRDEDVPTWEMLWPARARETNLSDRRWHIRGKWVDFDEADEIWGGTNRQVRNMLRGKAAMAANGIGDSTIPNTSELGAGSASGGMGAMGWGWGAANTGNFLNLAKKEVFVVEHEWAETEYLWRAAVPVRFYEWVAFHEAGQPLVVPTMDPQTQQPVEVPVQYQQYEQLPVDQQQAFMLSILDQTEIQLFEKRSDLSDFEDLYERVTGSEFMFSHKIGRRQVKFAVLLNNKVADYGVRPYGWSYHFITGFPFETRDGMDFFGVVDIIKGPQDYKNALISNMLAMYMSSPKGTLVVEQGLLPNANEFFDQLAAPSGAVIVKDGFFSQERHKFLDPPNYPPMIGPLLELASGGVETSLGLSPVDIGSQDDLRRVSGKVVQAAQLASNVIVAILFDAMRKFRRDYGLCNVRFLRYMYEPEQLIKIVGEEKAEDVPVDDAAWDDVLRYDIVIDEQPASANELMETLDFLTRTGELSQMRQRGDIQFEDQLELMPQIPASIKRKILKNRTVAEQKAQVEEQNQQLQGMVQQMYQFFEQSPEGQQLLAGFVSQYQTNQFSQQAFSQPGVPQAQAQ